MSKNVLPYSKYFMLMSLVIYLYPSTATMNSSNRTVVLIQGLPCDDVIEHDVIGEEKAKTSWPMECDHLCSHTEGCQSFTWSRRDSKCRLLRKSTPHSNECYVQSDHDFWYDRLLLYRPILSSIEI